MISRSGDTNPNRDRFHFQLRQDTGALAHDIGHTPFGHAGEHAIDRLLLELTHSSSSPGFNHYEHGVDIVRYLEGPYQYLTGQSHTGLNLTPEVCECIFKHTYCQGGNRISHDEIRKRSKHTAFLKDGYCHLEGQAVRIADKVSYLISDIEDGIRLNAIDERTIMSCRLFHRPPIDLSQPTGEPLLKRFLIQRRFILRVLMEDIISETGRRLAGKTVRSSVRSHDRYLIDHSATLAEDVSEVWNKLQAGRLHKDPRVIRASMNAAKIVSELMLLVAVFPELVPVDFRSEHERLWNGQYMAFYRTALQTHINVSQKLVEFLPLDSYIGLPDIQTKGSVVIPVEQMIMAKDYVASLTDIQARRLHGEYLL